MWGRAPDVYLGFGASLFQNDIFIPVDSTVKLSRGKLCEQPTVSPGKGWTSCCAHPCGLPGLQGFEFEPICQLDQKTLENIPQKIFKNASSCTSVHVTNLEHKPTRRHERQLI